MAWSVWLTLAGAAVLISLTPGAGAINTMTNSIGVGWARSIWGILGQQLALLVHIAVVAAGVGLLVAESHTLFNVVRYSGAAYLVALGIRQFRSPAGGTDEAERDQPRTTQWAMFRRGVLVNLTNPKAVVFFLAFTPQFIRPDSPLVAQYAVLATTVVAVDVLVMWFVFAFAARGLRRLTHDPRGRRRLGRVFGGLFVGVGALLATVH
jgi:homoserine/homoserine lactone efflux protein